VVDNPEQPATIARTLAGALGGGETITVGALVRAGGERAFALVLILLNLPNVIFAPPVLAGIAAVPTAVFGAQMMLGRSELWLPAAVLERSVRASALLRLLDRTGPWLDRLEAFGRPRLAFAAGAGARRILGLFAVVAALIVLLPVPGTNILPALALIVMAVATLRRDGVLFLIGAGIGILGVLVAVAAAGIAVGLVRWLWVALGL
jgi:hypothetical protein